MAHKDWTMENFEIRRASADDLERILPLVQAYRAFYEQEPDEARERAFIAAHLRDGTSVMYLAIAGSTMAAFMQLFKTYSTVHLATSWILEDLYVLPDYRKRGIAAALLNHAVQHAKDDGAAGMFLETAYENRPAQTVYERAGWLAEDRFRKYNAPLA